MENNIANFSDGFDQQNTSYQEAQQELPEYENESVQLEELGTGSFGKVEKIYDIKLNNYIALKFLMENNEDSNLKFKAEHNVLQAIKNLNDPSF